ncbi:MAG: hypothetical protein GY771_03045 [bacterium]|nr:hypothetical protein [bacterium]
MIRIKQIDSSDIPTVTQFCAGMGKEPAQREGRKLRKYWLEGYVNDKSDKKGDETPFRVFAALEDLYVRELVWPGEGKIPVEELAQIDGKLVTGILECSAAAVTPEPISDGDYWVLRCLWVIPPYLDKGIGGELVRRFINNARQMSRGAAVLAHRGSSPFDSYEAMPEDFFGKYGFIPIDNDGDNALLFMDFGIEENPSILRPVNDELGETEIELFWVNSCPALAWSARNIETKITDYSDLTFRSVEVKNREDVVKYGISNGLVVRGEVVERRLIFWSDVEKQLVKLGYKS